MITQKKSCSLVDQIASAANAVIMILPTTTTNIGSSVVIEKGMSFARLALPNTLKYGWKEMSTTISDWENKVEQQGDFTLCHVCPLPV